MYTILRCPRCKNCVVGLFILYDNIIVIIKNFLYALFMLGIHLLVDLSYP